MKPNSPTTIAAIAANVEGATSIVVLGPSGAFKKRVIEDLGHQLHHHKHSVQLMGANPGQPAWGPPASIALAALGGELIALTFIGTLDPLRQQGRYLAGISRLLAKTSPATTVLIDAPGATRGYTAEELLEHLLSTVRPSLIVVAADNGEGQRVAKLLGGRPHLEIAFVEPDEPLKRLSKTARKTLRTQMLDNSFAHTSTIRLERCQTLGFQPETTEGWQHRIVGLLDHNGDTLGIGEVLSAHQLEPDGYALDIRVSTLDAALKAEQIQRIVVGTLVRGSDHLVRTYTTGSARKTPRTPAHWTLAQRNRIPVPIAWPEMIGTAQYQPRMLNSLFGDPGLMLRHFQGGRAVLFDLGWLEEQLPGKVLHGVTDIFISHSHMDHTQGLVTLLRALMGPGGEVRLYGPPGLDKRVAHLLGAFRFNLLIDDGPIFFVHTLEGDQLHVHRIQCAEPLRVDHLETRHVPDGLVLDDSDFQVRAIEVQHSVPVLAYRAVTHCRLRPDGSPPLRPRTFELVYITDVAASHDNIQKLVKFAHKADLMVCEAAFMEADKARADKTRHMTTRATAELARAADVRRLVPFHISVRYQDNPEEVFAELMRHFDRVLPAVVPER